MLFKCKAMRLLAMTFLIGFLAAPTPGESPRKVTKLADGVYEIEHKDGSGGNTTVVIGERQVFVVDTCFLPSAAREDIAQIRQWTDKPVSFVLNTHFHNDHNIGNRAYMDAFPAVTIIAHERTKKEMDMFGPGSYRREAKTNEVIQELLATGKTKDLAYFDARNLTITEDDRKGLKDELPQRLAFAEELKTLKFQSATLTFDHDISIDIGNREVQVKFLGRGNTGGDAVVYLPKEKIVIAGDLVVYPIPYVYDGYPSEWIQTLQNLAQLDAETIVPGHGPILHDKTYLYLERDFMKSAVEQMNERLRQTSPAMFQSLADVKGGVDLSSFRQRFAGNDQELGAAFDEAATHLVKVVYEEATLR